MESAWEMHQISTNMPGVGLEICEMSRILRKEKILYERLNQWLCAKYVLLAFGLYVFIRYLNMDMCTVAEFSFAAILRYDN